MTSVGAHDRGAVCTCVATHSPAVLEYALHHVWPMGWGGPRDGEKVWLCPTAHVNVHQWLTWLRADFEGRLRPVPGARRGFAYDLARRGLEKWKESANG